MFYPLPENSDQVIANKTMYRLMKIVEKKKTIHNWPLFEVDLLDKWVSDSGKFILIGDAAHAMVPYLSMGRCPPFPII